MVPCEADCLYSSCVRKANAINESIYLLPHTPKYCGSKDYVFYGTSQHDFCLATAELATDLLDKQENSWTKFGFMPDKLSCCMNACTLDGKTEIDCESNFCNDIILDVCLALSLSGPLCVLNDKFTFYSTWDNACNSMDV